MAKRVQKEAKVARTKFGLFAVHSSAGPCVVAARGLHRHHGWCVCHTRVVVSRGPLTHSQTTTCSTGGPSLKARPTLPTRAASSSWTCAFRPTTRLPHPSACFSQRCRRERAPHTHTHPHHVQVYHPNVSQKTGDICLDILKVCSFGPCGREGSDWMCAQRKSGPLRSPLQHW